MRIFELNSEVQVARRTSDVFPFFSDAFNLERLTPPWLRFQVVTPGAIRMEVGNPGRIPVAPPRSTDPLDQRNHGVGASSSIRRSTGQGPLPPLDSRASLSRF